MREEEQLKESISAYLRLQYPKVIYRFDIAADIFLPIGVARKSKRIHKHEKGYPDLFIAEMRSGYGGYFLELKKDAYEVFTKKEGRFKKKVHLIEQLEFLERLAKKGYKVDWGLGFDDTKEKIDNYLKLKK